MARDKASRKFQLTINHPDKLDFTHAQIRTTLDGFTGLIYWCMSDEIGEQGTYHTHIYLAFRNAVEFVTIHQRFYGAHIELARGSHQENRDYIRKEGKWQEDAKHKTSVPGTFEESGELPPERSRRQTFSEEVVSMIEAGASNAEIVQEYPSAFRNLNQIEQTRQTLREAAYRTAWRTLHTVYLWGAPGVGKTRSIMERFGYECVFRVTNYAHPFDSYAGQDVILFDEFRSSLPFSDMLNYLDGYPLMLPCRFADKVACYTKVFIVSNIPLDEQYPNIQATEAKSYGAFLRRIHETVEMLPGGPDMPF